MGKGGAVNAGASAPQVAASHAGATTAAAGATQPRQLLAGVTVVDLTTDIAGPYGTMFLADHGARIIKVEPAGGDPFRSQPGFQTINRGKLSIELDYKNSTEAQASVRQLAGSCDLFIVDFTQVEAAAWGLDYPSIKAVNPAAMYISMPPYGETGPLVGRPYSPALLAAEVGLMGTQISHSGDPMYHVLPLVAYGSGMLLAITSMATLVGRTGGAPGQWIQTSQLAGALMLLHGADRAMLNKHPMGSVGPIAPYRCYQAGDGRWFFLACANQWFFTRMMKAVGLESLLDDPRLENAWVFTNQAPGPREVLVPALEAVFKTQPREHWLQVFLDADVPAQPVSTRDEFFNGPVVAANHMKVFVDHPELGKIAMMGVPIILTGCPGRVAGRAPLLDEHRSAILASAKPGDEAKAVEDSHTPAVPEGGFLAGVKVLDLSSYIAGPLGPRHLGMFGASVIKVESPGGDPFRSHKGFPDFNQGKRSICLDLKNPEGLRLFHRMVQDADVVVENFRPDVTARLGVDYATLSAINPRLIYLSSPGFGQYGEYIRRPAFDPLLQAMSGAMLTQGGGNTPIIHTIPLNDVFTAAMGAFGVASALLHRAKTGRGQRVHVSLAQSSLAIQACEFTRYTDAPAPMYGGRDFAGPCAFEHLYRAADGSFAFVEAKSDAQRAALLSLTGASAAASDDELVAAFGATIAAAPTAETFVATALKAGVPAATAGGCNAHWRHPALVSAGLITDLPHPDTGAAEPRLGMLIRTSATTHILKHRAPRFGEHTRNVLIELGLDTACIDQLHADGIVRSADTDITAVA